MNCWYLDHGKEMLRYAEGDLDDSKERAILAEPANFQERERGKVNLDRLTLRRRLQQGLAVDGARKSATSRPCPRSPGTNRNSRTMQIARSHTSDATVVGS